MTNTDQEQITTTTQITEQAEKVEPIAIYQNNIYALVDDIKQLPQFINKTDQELKDDKSFFPVLVNYIYNNYIGELLGNKHGRQVAYKDIQMIDNIFNIYVDLVYKYKWNNKPFIIEFSNFIGISRDTIYNWLNGSDSNIYNQADGKRASEYLTRERSDIVRKWLDICEGALLNGASNDTIRDIFILKAKYNYNDHNADINITVNHKQIIGADELPALLDINGNN